LLVKVHTAYGTFWKQTELADLIREVDSYRGKPSPEMVKKLAEKYGDTEEYVWSLFRTRRFRKGKKWRELRDRARKALSCRKQDEKNMWLTEEIEFLKANWQHMTDEELARAISALPCNRARGKVRNRNGVAKKRCDLGLRKRKA